MPQRVTAAELKAHWMNPSAAGMVDDHQRGVRIVRMEDGTEYETPFGELVAAQ